ncbi:MAG: CAAD domain-containing protein [Goleter apudmare HA4340-LM2]|jgi:ABC-type transport system involved in cytochrome bd biosynthesis fused ATPase/permease subunit|nr:CAAD domain-containing protein [Goleter apudmare HA4340-LM2]
METQQHPNEVVNATSAQGMIALTGVGTENLPALPPAREPDTQWGQWNQRVTHFLAQLPEYIGSFFQQNQQALVNVALILSAIVTLKVVGAILSAIHDVPLLSPIFEVIGIAYATWFVFRYLLKATTRQELAAKIELIKQQIVGEDIAKPLT